jgi:phosphotransferase system HPr (HPr) family protein
MQGRGANHGASRGGPGRGESSPDLAAPGGTAGCSQACDKIRRAIRVVNPRGLHPRIIDFFTKKAKQFQSAVTVWNGEVRADGKSVFDLILLVVLPETEVVLEVEGPDATAAFDSLAKVLAAEGGEDYTI